MTKHEYTTESFQRWKCEMGEKKFANHTHTMGNWKQKKHIGKPTFEIWIWIYSNKNKAKDRKKIYLKNPNEIIYLCHRHVILCDSCARFYIGHADRIHNVHETTRLQTFFRCLRSFFFNFLRIWEGFLSGGLIDVRFAILYCRN